MDRPSNKKDILTPTDKVTSAGRKLYKTSDGDFVSEKTTTVQNPNNNLWYNIPTINNGRKMSVDKAAELYLGSSEVKDVETGRVIPSFKTVEEAVKAAKTRSQSLSRGQKLMNNQMKQFEKGGEVDPVSGNDVPLGSTEKEVRDDQPAMLSEGEMVVPADVVRYFGVEHFMKLRDEAKMGYKKMEAMGQFGTDEGKTLPDDTLFNAGGPPFTIEDIEVIEPDDLENLEGGEEDTLEANAGAFVQGGQGTNPFDNTASTTAGQQFAAGKPITSSSFNQPAFTFDSFKGFSGLTSDYIQSFLPDAFKKKKNKPQINIATNIIDQFFRDKLPQQAQEASTKSGQSDQLSDEPDAGGNSDLSSATPGIGSVSELMSNPSTASLGALAGFGQMLDSPLGLATLSAVNRGISMAMTPSTGYMTALMKGAAALSPTISKGFDVLSNIATTDAVTAKNATMAMEVELGNLSPAELTDLNTYSAHAAISAATGYDPTTDPSVTAIGRTSMGVPGYSVTGRFGATYGWNDIHGWEVVAGKISEIDPNKAKTKTQQITQSVVETMQMMDDPAIADRMGPGPQSAEDAMGIDDAADAEAAGAGTAAGTAGTGGPDSSGDGHDGTDGGNDGSDAADAAADAADAADTGEAPGGTDNDGDNDGPSAGDDYNKGGLINRKPPSKKRGGRKRKKRGGLGSRK